MTKSEHQAPGFSALGESIGAFIGGSVAGFTPTKWVEKWRLQVRADGLGSLPDRNSLEIVYDCAGGGQMVVVGKHTGIDCLTLTNANLIVEAVNSHARLLRERDQLKAVLAKQVAYTNQLARMVNDFAGKLGLGNKVNADDWTEKARAALASVQPENEK